MARPGRRPVRRPPQQPPKYVVSDTLTEADATWAPTTIIRGADLVSRWRRCASSRAGYVNVTGSASLARALLADDLVDDLLLMIEPIVLGGG